MVDPARVRRLLEALAGYRVQLERLCDLPADQYEGDSALAGRYLVQASAQACIDIANHVIASSGWRTPEDFRDSFTVLEEGGAIDGELAERMRALPGSATAWPISTRTSTTASSMSRSARDSST
jgi:uncharacterized protein YutE (UPF0331/DUF86 family)